MGRWRSERSITAPVVVCLALFLVATWVMAALPRISLRAYACDNKPCTKRQVISFRKRDSLHVVEVVVPIRSENRKLRLLLFQDGEATTSEPLERPLELQNSPIVSFPFRDLSAGDYEAVGQLIATDGVFTERARFVVLESQ